MPRVVDHEQRRAELIDVVWQLIVDDGLPGVTIRRVADRSGWSSGAVRHYLPTREAMVDVAAQKVGAVIEQRVRAVPTDSHPRQALAGVLAAVLPDDDRMRQASRVWLAFVGQAASDRSLAERQGIVYHDLNDLLVQLLDWASTEGAQVVGGSTAAAAQFQALVDGLTVHVLLGQVDAATAQQVLQRAVDAVLGAD